MQEKLPLFEIARFIFGYLRRYPFSYSVGISLLFLTNYIALTVPEYLKKSIDLLEQDFANASEQVFYYSLIIGLLAPALFFSRTISRILFFNPARSIEHELKGDVLKKVTLVGSEHFGEQGAGTVISKINNDLTGVRHACGFALMQFFNTLSFFALTPYMMYQISPKLTLYVILPLVIIFFTIRTGMSDLRKYYEKKQRQLQNISDFTLESLSGIDVVRSYLMKSWAGNTFLQHNEGYKAVALKIAFIRSFVFPLFNYIDPMMKLVVLLAGGMMYFEGELTLGDITAMFGYSLLISQPLMGVGWVITIFQEAVVGITSVLSVLKLPEPPKISIREKEPDTSSLFKNNSIRVENLSFQYPGADEKSLDKISFEISPGSVIGVLGEVGSGKSTLVHCLNKYLPTAPGQIRIGKREINEFSDREWRQIVRTVTQEPFLFSDTVENNILFSAEKEPELSPQEWKEIYFRSALQNEIETFPEKGKTMVGEKGIMLSGGQKQRISLARALLQPCDLLILDNILSAVDYQTESFLLDQILKKGRTGSLLIVSHRTKAMEKADQILVLKKGKIVEQGTHEELFADNGEYAKTWKLQNEGADVES